MITRFQKYLKTLLLFLLCLTACTSPLMGKTQPVVSSTPFPELEAETITPTPSFTQTPTFTLRDKSISEMLAVVDVVERYYDDFGYYPKSMNDLIPTYLAEIPYTSEGFEIKYSLDETRYIYSVKFWIADNRLCAYVKIENEWECGFTVGD